MQAGRDFYKKEQPQSDNKAESETMLACFATVSEKRHHTTDATIRNQQGVIKNIEIQLELLTTLVNEWLPPKNPDPVPQPHVMAIFIEE